jgi:hypothetical protein
MSNTKNLFIFHREGVNATSVRQVGARFRNLDHAWPFGFIMEVK